MSRGSIIYSLLTLCAILFTSYVWVCAQDAQMRIEHKTVFGELQRPAVKFDHERHSEVYPDCVECHHEYEYKDGKKDNVWAGEGQPCSECHKMQEEGKKVSLRTAFHEGCTDCHRTLAREGKKTGPATCGECHVRGN
jgi:hypothetical protein